MKPIQVFEYEKLLVNDQFTDDHLNALAIYNEEHGDSFFRLGYKSVQFQQYVGVIQVGDLTIEILPKIGKVAPNEEKAKWQKALIDMLKECNWMNVHANQKAFLQHKYNSILEAYLELFIRECESLLQQGLIKKYRQTENNKYSLKGKLLFGKNIQQNVVHQERFYTRHQVYDRNNIFNQILYKALRLIPKISSNPFLNDRVYNLLFSFPEMDDIQVTPKLFSNLVFDRKSGTYEEAIGIASMILLNYRPDIQRGQNNVLAILFDMNDLWEEFVYRQIKRYCPKEVNIIPKVEKKIWKSDGPRKKYKKVIPDIVLSKNKKTLVLDTKWKLPENDIPDDSDLKQMFVYNEFWNKANAVLFYPKESGETTIEEGVFLPIDYDTNCMQPPQHKCCVMKASVISSETEKNEAILDFRFGEKMIRELEKKKLI